MPQTPSFFIQRGHSLYNFPAGQRLSLRSGAASATQPVSRPSISPMATKQSQATLIRLLESGLREVGDLDKGRFFIIVQNVVASGSPPDSLVASVSVRFLPGGAPYCCGEPSCYSRVFRDDGIADLGDFMRRKMNLRQTVSVELKVHAEYYDGISFSAHRGG